MNASLWAATQPESHKNTWRLFFAIMVGIAVLFVAAQNVNWTGNTNADMGAEIIATGMAGLIGLALLARQSVVREPAGFLLSITFLGTALLNLFHLVAGHSAVGDAIGDAESIHTISWYLSRLFFATFAAAFGWIVSKPHIAKITCPKSIGIAAALGVVVVITVSLTVRMPDPMPKVLFFQPPADLLIGLMFLGAFITFARNGIGPLGHVHSWIAISLAVNAVIHLLFMSMSHEWLDANYSAAHVLKLFAYFLVSIGITQDSHTSYKREKLAASELGRVNEALNNRNLELTTARNDLATLTRLAAISSSSVAIDDHFDEFCEELTKRVPADRILVITTNDDLTVGRIEAVWGLVLPNRTIMAEVPTEGTMMTELFGRRVTLVWDEKSVLEVVKNDPRLQVDIDAGIKSWISTPVIARGRVIGAVMVRSMRSNVYGAREITFLEQVAAQVAGPLDVSRQVQGFHGSAAAKRAS